MKQQRHHCFANEGFSLAELLIAVAVLMILTGLLVPQLTRLSDSGEQEQALAELKALDIALENYRNQQGGYPLTANGGVSLLQSLNLVPPGLNLAVYSYSCPVAGAGNPGYRLSKTLSDGRTVVSSPRSLP